MGSYQRATRRRAVQRGAGRSYDSYSVRALRDPGEPGHVLVELGIGREGAPPSACLRLCSHTLDAFLSDLRLAVAEAELHGHASIGAGADVT